MAKLVFGMNMTLDGFVDHDGGFVPDSVLFAHFVEQTRRAAGSIYGRVLYETMRYWDGDAWIDDSPARGDLPAFAQAWRAMPKWVVSRSLKDVGPNATLLGTDFEADIRRIKAEHDGDIEVGGPRLAAFLGERGLIDEYHVFLHPFVLGSGTPFFGGTRPKLRTAGCERIGESAIKLTYVPA